MKKKRKFKRFDMFFILLLIAAIVSIAWISFDERDIRFSELHHFKGISLKGDVVSDNTLTVKRSDVHSPDTDCMMPFSAGYEMIIDKDIKSIRMTMSCTDENDGRYDIQYSDENIFSDSFGPEGLETAAFIKGPQDAMISTTFLGFQLNKEKTLAEKNMVFENIKAGKHFIIFDFASFAMIENDINLKCRLILKDGMIGRYNKEFNVDFRNDI